ncbi:hypothetical protein LK09_17795 [Microbacterium mangrovi]|uniref:DUF1648 domain-containing protein n=1 Tax=Microbacterium mangrovi TaxID=1348253 RepID=A0A0B1ZYQ3_9MICO|nr:hypothetical protein LK09_17795 [Microbacterium mangrovi]
MTAAAYDGLPAMIPTHWGITGPDVYSAKTPWTVAMPIAISGLVLAGLFAVSFVNRTMPVRPLPAAEPEVGAARTARLRAALSSFFGRVMFAVTLLTSWSSVLGWVAPDAGWLTSVFPIAVVILIVGILVAFWVRWRQLTRADGDTPAPRSSDEADHWKAGFLYVDPADRSLFVPKRLGVGWTVNFGHPGGIAIGILLLAVIGALIAFGLTAGN